MLCVVCDHLSLLITSHNVLRFGFCYFQRSAELPGMGLGDIESGCLRFYVTF